MGFIRKFVIYGSIFWFLQSSPAQGRERRRRQALPNFTPLDTILSPWIPIKDSQPRFVRQDAGAVKEVKNQSEPLVFSPVRQEKPLVQARESVVSRGSTNQRARQLAQSGDWIPLAPVDASINTVEGPPQFNPIVTLNNIPGKRLPITALDPLLFSRDQAVVIPSNRPVLPNPFQGSPATVVINEPVTRTPVAIPPIRSFPAIQSIPAKVSENGRVPPRINRPQTTKTTTTIASTVSGTAIPQTGVENSLSSVKPVVSIANLTVQNEQNRLADSERTTLRVVLTTVSVTESTKAVNDPVVDTSTLVPLTPETSASFSTNAATSAPGKKDETSRSTENPLKSVGSSTPASVSEPPPGNLIVDNDNKIFDAPLILGPNLADVVRTTEKLTFVPTTELEQQNKTVQNATAPNDDFSSSEDEEKVKLSETLPEATDLVSDAVTEKENDELSREVHESTVISLLESIANGHQGRLPASFGASDNDNSSDKETVAHSVSSPPPAGDSEEEDIEQDSVSSKVMNGHQPPITEVVDLETSDITDDVPEYLNPEDYSDYNISPPGLMFNFTDDPNFNVSLVDFGNGTVVLQNKTYILSSDSVAENDTEEPGITFEDEEDTVLRSQLNFTLNQDDDIKDSVFFETEDDKETALDVNVSNGTDVKSANDTALEGNDNSNATDDIIIFELTSARNPTSELEIIEVVTSAPSTPVSSTESTSQSTASSESSASFSSFSREESSTISTLESSSSTLSTIESLSSTVSTIDSSSSSTTEETSSSRTTEAATAESTQPASAETSRELDKQTTPLATIINSIISALTTQKGDVTTPSTTAEKETTRPTVPTTSTSQSTTWAPTTEPEPSTERKSSTVNVEATTKVTTDLPFQGAQETEPKVLLYIRIELDLTWRELCENIDDFKSTLAQIVSNDPEIGTTISHRQVVVYNIGRCALELHSSRRRRRVSEPATALCYVTDYHGVYSHRLTEALARGLNSSGRGQTPLAEKIMSAMPVKSTSESLAVGSHQHVPTTGVIAGITVAVILGLILLSFLVFLLIVRRRQNRATFARRCEPGSEFGIRNSIRNLSWRQSKSQLRASKRSFMNYAYEDPSAPTRPLLASRIVEVVQDSATLEKEFKQIPLPATTLDDLPPGVESKNRFSNVIPVPDTRVLLKPIAGDDTSEYINANYVRGPRDEPQYYIACQAPLESTVSDFWRMIWEKQSKLIIQLTDLFENGSAKCADYLPPSEVLDCHRLYGDFQVTLKRRELKQGYIVSFVTLKHMNDNLRRDVVHYWFTGWPHSGIPEDPKQLVSMLIESRTASRDGGSPIVVHCCPGTGRTGTVIAIELLTRIVDTKKPVDVPRVVYKLRRDRSGCVQTKEQYQFIYQALAWYVASLQSAEISK